MRGKFVINRISGLPVIVTKKINVGPSPTSYDKHRMKNNNIKLSSKQRKGNPQVLGTESELETEWTADELI